MDGHRFVNEDILCRLIVRVNLHEELLNIRFVHLFQGQTNGILCRCTRFQGIAREDLCEQNSWMNEWRGDLLRLTLDAFESCWGINGRLIESVDWDNPLSEECSSPSVWRVTRVESLTADDAELLPESASSISTLLMVFVNVARAWSSSSNWALMAAETLRLCEAFVRRRNVLFSSNRCSSVWSCSSKKSRSSSKCPTSSTCRSSNSFFLFFDEMPGDICSVDVFSSFLANDSTRQTSSCFTYLFVIELTSSLEHQSLVLRRECRGNKSFLIDLCSSLAWPIVSVM